MYGVNSHERYMEGDLKNKRGDERYFLHRSNAKRLTVDEYMANVGVDMLHPGGMRSTDELVGICRIKEGVKVLDVGCGYGKTACYLAKKYSCKVTGIDLSELMIRGARHRVKKKHLENMIHLEVMDAQNLRFEDESFDAVISEGTTVFLDKIKAITEYLRVTKPGGYIGLTELTWRVKPPEVLIEKAIKTLEGVKPLEYNQWIELLTECGLRGIESKLYNYRSFSWDNIRAIGFAGLMKVAFKYIRNSEIREWIRRQETLFKEYAGYWGYGLYAGKR